MGKVALVTGGGRGIGRGIALTLAGAGYDVAITYRTNREEAEHTAARLEQLGSQALVVQADVCELQDIDRLMDEVAGCFGQLDLLVNNAGITKFAPFLEMTPEIFDNVMGTDLRGLYFCSQAAARLMVKQGTPGTIIQISSNHANGCWPKATVYAAAKAAVNKLTANMAMELAPHGIRVVGIAPGYTMFEKWDEQARQSLDGNSWRQSLANRIPMARFAGTTEIGEAVVFLASDKAGYITGTTLFIDGGALLPTVAEYPFS